MEFPPFKLERFFAKYEFNTPYLLSASDCESFTVSELLELGNLDATSLTNLRLGYTESQGDPELRVEISNMYETTNQDNILTLTGAEEGVFIVMTSLLKAGDHIIVQFPCYQSLYSVAESRGVQISRWEMNEKENWALDLKILNGMIKDNTKMIVINFPHNPTGSIMDQNDYKELIEIAQKRNIILFSDEVYRFLEFDPANQLLPACDLYENAISLGVMSKTFGLPGIRVGWLASQNTKFIGRFQEIKDYTTICGSRTSEFLAQIALSVKEKIIKRNLGISKSNLTLLIKFMEKWFDTFTMVIPKGAPIAFPSFNYDINAEDFVEGARDLGRVLLLPSEVYNYGNRNFRLGFGQINFPEALHQFDNYIEIINGGSYTARKKL